MSTDRELLKNAAKAVGVCLHPAEQLSHSYGNWGCDTTCMLCKKDPADARWNPLTDDGDALRLAVKLRITPFLHGMEASASYCHEPYGDDPCAATRRAIVRAAAAIGAAQ